MDPVKAASLFIVSLIDYFNGGVNSLIYPFRIHPHLNVISDIEYFEIDTIDST